MNYLFVNNEYIKIAAVLSTRLARCFLSVALLTNALHLSHVVMPLYAGQGQKAINNLAQWSNLIPCQLQQPIAFVLFCAHQERIDRSVRSNLYNALYKLAQTVQLCFSPYIQESTVLDGVHNTHLIASRVMFEMVINGSLNSLKNASAILYMEPDTRPVRSHWLDALADDVRGDFLVRGSIYMGDPQLILHPYLVQHNRSPSIAYHVNGNALYNIGDGRLLKLYVTLVKPWAENTFGRHLSAYDTDFWDFLFHISNFAVAREYIHLYQRTGRILNMYRTRWSLTNITRGRDVVLVHGGHPEQ